MQRIALNSPKAKFIYIAFSKAIADASKRSFPANVQCRTAHSLAFRTHGHKYADRIAGSLSTAVASQLLSEYTQAVVKQAAAALAVFWASASAAVSPEHLQKTDEDSSAEEVDQIVQAATLLWKLMVEQSPGAPMTHDGYLKLWQLHSAPMPAADCILLDECQDCSPCVLHALQERYVVAVGDPHQRIFGWRGAAVNSLQPTHQLTCSFRCAPAICALASRLMNAAVPEAKFVLRAASANPAGAIGPIDKALPHAFIARTNAALIEVCRCIYTGVCLLCLMVVCLMVIRLLCLMVVRLLCLMCSGVALMCGGVTGGDLCI